MTLRTIVIGASGYAGSELVRLLQAHERVSLTHIYVSENSADKGKKISDLYGKLFGVCDMTLEPLENVDEVAKNADVVFLATDHKVSHDLAKTFVNNNCHVFDLSGAFRVNDLEFYDKYYDFTHENGDLLAKAVYGLCEWCDILDLQDTRLIALPGCYPTASELALKPLIEAKIIDTNFKPIINAISGVTGSGRKASLTSSFCEVSTQAYKIFNHRHKPEIEQELGTKVIFNPHLGNFKRGILATVSAKLTDFYTKDEISEIYYDAYKVSPMVRLKDSMPRIQDVEGTPYCDIGFSVDDGYIVICSCIDNLLKGAASQAIQAMNLHFAFEETTALL